MTGSPNGIHHSAAAADNRTLFRHVLQTLLRGAWILVVFLVLMVGLVLAYLQFADPVYRAETSVIIEKTSGDEAFDFAGISAFRDVLVEVEVLRSLDLSKRVADRLLSMRTEGGDAAPLASWPIFEEATDPTLTVVTLARELQDRIDIEQIRREVGIVRIGVRSTLPEEAQYIANVFADEYVQRNLALSREEAAGLRAFLEDQMAERQTELLDAEGELQNYQEREGAIALDQEVDELTRRMADLQSRRDQAQVELDVVESELLALQSQIDAIEPNLYARVASGLETEILSLQSEIASIETQMELKYARNPSLRGNESSDPDLERSVLELERLRREVASRAQRYVDEVMSTGGIDPDIARRIGEGSSVPGALANVSRLRQQVTDKTIQASGLRARLSVLGGRLGQYQREFNRIPEQTRQLAGLERSRQSTALTYAWLQERYQEARIAEASEFGNVRVLDVAERPDEPVEPRPIYLLALAILLATGLGLMFIFAREMVDDRLRLPEEIRNTGIPVAGVIPDLRKVARLARSRLIRTGPAPEVVTVHQPSSAAADAFARVAMSLEMGATGRPVQNLFVTSSKTSDGKSVVAANLAVTMASAGHRTLLIDLNAWHPSVHNLMQAPSVPGVGNVLYEGRLVRECVHPTDVEGLYVMPLGDIDVTDGHFLASQDLTAMLNYLRRSFARIVIDGGPLLSAGRAVALSGLADAVALVVRSGQTNKGDLAEAMDLLEQARAAHTQVVLNGFNARASYGYFADRSYYGRFGSGSERQLQAAPASNGLLPMRKAPDRLAFRDAPQQTAAPVSSAPPAQATIYGPSTPGESGPAWTDA